MKKMNRKQAKDENFPVGMLISPKLKNIVQTYYQAARDADDAADNPLLSAEQKKAVLDNIELAFRQPDRPTEFKSAAKLGRLFAAENLDSSLYTDLLTAFRMDAENQPIEIWEQLLNYCNYSAVPVGRFMLAIHNENPSSYLPAATLCAVLQITNHLQDLKKDAVNLQRFYLPHEMMEQHGARYSDIYLSFTKPALREVINETTDKLRMMLQDAEPIFKIVKNIRLKWELGVIFSLTNSMIKKIERRDVLHDNIRLNGFDWIKALGSGLNRILWQKH